MKHKSFNQRSAKQNVEFLFSGHIRKSELRNHKTSQPGERKMVIMMIEQQGSKNSKPEMEAVLGEALCGGALKTALDLTAFLRENKMKPVWSAANVWKVTYKTYTVCFMRLYGAAEYHGLQEGTWQMIPFIGEYEVSALPDADKEIVWKNKRTCANCGVCCLQLEHVFGKAYDHACEKSVVFINPDARDAECIKKLIELRKNAVKEGNAKKHQYVAMKDRK